jgi:hypothetical protein
MAKKTTTENGVENAFASVETMSNAARDQFDTISAAFTKNAETAREQAEDMIESFRGSFENARTRMQTVNAELVSAAREEAANAVDFVNDLARAKSVADMLEIQRGYWSNLFDTRVERTKKLANVSVEAARETFEPISKSLTAFSANASFDKFMPFSAK